MRLRQAGAGPETPKNDAFDLAVQAAAGVTLDLGLGLRAQGTFRFVVTR